MAGEIAFIELGVADAGKAETFYTALFGWRFEAGPSPEGRMISGLGVTAGVHSGDPAAAPYVFFRVEDVDTAVARVRELGGAVEEIDVEGDEDMQRRYGRFRLCRDDQGSSFGLYAPPRSQ
ncbi:MAG TPA: VOC family protein [Longimicrobiales bacterium]|nr:VOC family protein [Longimicrobiales bacterium]